MKLSRRKTLKGLSALSLSAFASPAIAALRTPAATEGPFYPTSSMRFADIDNNLVKIWGEVEHAGGEVIILKGRVLDRTGRPVPGARVEIWQCDVNGRYLHRGDRGGSSRDPSFQGFGHIISGADGAYTFRTIKPVTYPGRTPHIHVKVMHGQRELTTQFYIDGHPLNARDWLFQRMSPSEQRAVSMTFNNVSMSPTAVVDLRL